MRQLRRCARATAGIENYPSLPEFTHPWTSGSSQNPPSAWRMVSEELAQERRAGLANSCVAPWSTRPARRKLEPNRLLPRHAQVGRARCALAQAW